MKGFGALVAVVMGCSLTALPALHAEDSTSVRRAAVGERISLNFRATPIEEVFDMLSRKDSVNIILSKGVSGTVSVNLYNVTVREAIYRVAEAAGYWVEERSGDYVIVSR